MLQHLKRVAVKLPVINRNEYNEEIITYIDSEPIEMFISFSNVAPVEQNDSRFYDYTHIGLTKADVSKGTRINEKYEVQYALESKPFNRVFLKELEEWL